jgi:predicted acetyltransferase
VALEIRPYRSEEADEFARLQAIVFGSYTGRRRSEEPAEQRGPDLPPELSVCAFEDGVMASTYAAYPISMRLNGAAAPTAGVTCVGTLPWYRRRGYLRKIMEYDFKRRYEERLEPIAILGASIAAIYQRYGYAVCSSRYAYTIDPKKIDMVPSLSPSQGAWREASRDELPLLQTMFRHFSEPRNGYLERTPAVWESHIMGLGPHFVGPNFGPSLIALYEKAGSPEAYIAYAALSLEQAVDGAGPGQRLVVRDVVYQTPSAYRAVWEFLETFDLVKRVIWPVAPIDDLAFDILLDPRELNATRTDLLLGRIIDAERALPLRPYGEGRVIFNLRDEMCPWNDGRWALESGAEGAILTRTKDSASLSLDVSALAQLLFGHMSPTRATRCGRAEATTNAPLAMWDAMFRTAYEPFCPDSF